MRKIRKYKDERITYYRIKIDRIREVKGYKNYREYKDKLWCVDCRNFSGSGVMFCETTIRKALKYLKGILTSGYL